MREEGKERKKRDRRMEREERRGKKTKKRAGEIKGRRDKKVKRAMGCEKYIQVFFLSPFYPIGTGAWRNAGVLQTRMQGQGMETLSAVRIQGLA